MTDLPAEVNRPLDELEKSLLIRLAIYVVASQTGAEEQAAADALDHFTESGEAWFRGDARDAYLVVAGNSLVHATREWLAFHAHSPEWAGDSPSDEEGST